MIDELAITNFKAFATAEIPLGPYTLLSGLNSSGKSTVLQALALLRQSFDALHEDDGGFLLNGGLIELGVGQDILHEDYVSSDETDPRIRLALRCGSEIYSWSVRYEREADLLRMDDSAERPDPVLPPSLSGTGFQYLRADRISPAVSYPRSHEIAVRRSFLGSRGEHTVNFLRHFQDEPVADERLHHPEGRSRSLLDQTEAWMQEICPGVNLQADAIEGTDSVRLSFRFGTAGLSASNRYRPTNVGFGLTYVLPVVVACLTAKPGGLLLIENPEAHLHPRGQTGMAMLTCAAAAAGAQVVVETHSDHVLNGVRLAVKGRRLPPENAVLHYFRKKTGGIEILNPVIGPDGMISDWPEGFFDEWERSLDRLLD
ncbi:DUF3696 domain-containing protein [Microbispora siamensis]